MRSSYASLVSARIIVTSTGLHILTIHVTSSFFLFSNGSGKYFHIFYVQSAFFLASGFGPINTREACVAGRCRIIKPIAAILLSILVHSVPSCLLVAETFDLPSSSLSVSRQCHWPQAWTLQDQFPFFFLTSIEVEFQV